MGIADGFLDNSIANSDFQKISLSPRRLDMETFAMEAQIKGALIFLAVQGQVCESGRLQAFFDERFVLYTGCSSQETHTVADKHKLFIQLNHLHHYGIYCSLTHKMTYREITDMLEEEPDCEACFEYLVRLISPVSSSICVKPITKEIYPIETNLDNPADLSLYLRAVRDGWDSIPPDTLSTTHDLVRLPSKPCSYQFEKNIKTVDFNDGRWDEKYNGKSKNSKWVAVSIGLIGTKHNIHSFSPSLVQTKGKVDINYEKKKIKRI